ncbi:hypothetical protein Y032_0009g697 [Ancylostoma ceylanicum]|uniref:Uncharacterized protein n=1 Tax=Ancylostoma ceylanicum TaxID=53326 RepID=A0A016VIE3_9BILA|nr:hypothetical protein Y032_0009g697 [Ancylostoma ceylanicum]
MDHASNLSGVSLSLYSVHRGATVSDHLTLLTCKPNSLTTSDPYSFGFRDILARVRFLLWAFNTGLVC